MKIPCLPLFVDEFISNGNNLGCFSSTHMERAQRVKQRNSCTLFLLSHFHTDHMKGLSSQWCGGPIICSEVTRALLTQRFGERVGSLVVAIPMWRRIGLLRTKLVGGVSARDCDHGEIATGMTMPGGSVDQYSTDNHLRGDESGTDSAPCSVRGESNESLVGSTRRAMCSTVCDGVMCGDERESANGRPVLKDGRGGISERGLRRCAEEERTSEEVVVYVTMLPAFHIPGSAMFFFETPMGNLLHTGDFKFNAQAKEWLAPFFLRHRVDHVYIDDTWLHLGKEENVPVSHACCVCPNHLRYSSQRCSEEGGDEGDSTEWENKPQAASRHGSVAVETDGTCEAENGLPAAFRAGGRYSTQRGALHRRAEKSSVNTPPSTSHFTRRLCRAGVGVSSSIVYHSGSCAIRPRECSSQCRICLAQRNVTLGSSISSHLLNEEQLVEAFEAVRKRMELQKEKYEALHQRNHEEIAIGPPQPREERLRTTILTTPAPSSSVLPYRLRVYLHNQFGKEILVQRLAMTLGTRVLLDDQRYARLLTVSEAMRKEEDQGKNVYHSNAYDDRGEEANNELTAIQEQQSSPPFGNTVPDTEQFHDLLARLWHSRGGERSVYGVNLEYFVPYRLVSSTPAHCYSLSSSPPLSLHALPRGSSLSEGCAPLSSPQPGSSESLDRVSHFCVEDDPVVALPARDTVNTAREKDVVLSHSRAAPPPLMEVVHRRSDIDPVLLQHMTSVLQTPHYAVHMSGWARRNSHRISCYGSGLGNSRSRGGGRGADQTGGAAADTSGVWHIPTTLHCTPQEIVDFVSLLRPLSVTPFHYSPAKDLVVLRRLGQYFRKPYENAHLKLYGSCQDVLSHVCWESLLPFAPSRDRAARETVRDDVIGVDERRKREVFNHRHLGYQLRKREREHQNRPGARRVPLRNCCACGRTDRLSFMIECAAFDVDANKNQGGIRRCANNATREVPFHKQRPDLGTNNEDEDDDDIARLLWGSSPPTPVRISPDRESRGVDVDLQSAGGSQARRLASSVSLSSTSSPCPSRCSSVVALSREPVRINGDAWHGSCSSLNGAAAPTEKTTSTPMVWSDKPVDVVSVDSGFSSYKSTSQSVHDTIAGLDDSTSRRETPLRDWNNSLSRCETGFSCGNVSLSPPTARPPPAVSSWHQCYSISTTPPTNEHSSSSSDDDDDDDNDNEFHRDTSVDEVFPREAGLESRNANLHHLYTRITSSKEREEAEPLFNLYHLKNEKE